MTIGQLLLPFDVGSARPARATASEDVSDRAARLALSIAGVVARARLSSAREIQQARLDLAELERLCGVVDTELPAIGRDVSARGAWVGFGPAHDDDQDAAALACWAALGSPIEAHLLGWRAALSAAAKAQPGPARARRRATARTAA